VFHDNLSLLWPWHNSMDSLYTILGRADTLYGYYGKELRLPYLDQRLVQTWLNTTVDLKNKGYKHWLVEYMKQNDYPYHLDKVGLSGRRWN
jgi:asparagine synthetase B (glutamine-hydrolysing)